MNMEEIWNSLSQEAKEYLEDQSKTAPQRFVQQVSEYLEGHKFKHTNGNVYTVLFLTNTNSDPERWKDHPIDAIYQGANGFKWSRPLEDWFRSFTKITI